MFEVSQRLKEFLNNHFNFNESQFNDRVNIYSSKDIRLRIEKDLNAKPFMDISTKENPQTPTDWIILSDLKSYMLNNDDYLKENGFEEESNFLIDNYQQIVEFLKTNCSATVEALKERGENRAEIKYGKYGYKRPKKEHALDYAQPSQQDNKDNSKPWWKFW